MEGNKEPLIKKSEDIASIYGLPTEYFNHLTYSSIKDEADNKTTKSNLNSSREVSIEPNTDTKTEESEEKLDGSTNDAEMGDQQESDIRDTDNYCSACDKRYAHKGSYVTHMRKVHHQGLRIRNPHLLPDEYDPNNYCRTCEKTYSSKHYYRTHLQQFHQMTLGPVSIRNPLVFPDEHDPNFYCRSCEKTYISRESYHFHLKKIHAMTLGITRIPNPDREQQDNLHCSTCNKSFSLDYFRIHLQLFHKRKQTATEDTPVEESKASNYCKLCKKAFSSNTIYSFHLQFHKTTDDIASPFSQKKSSEKKYKRRPLSSNSQLDK